MWGGEHAVPCGEGCQSPWLEPARAGRRTLGSKGGAKL